MAEGHGLYFSSGDEARRGYRAQADLSASIAAATGKTASLLSQVDEFGDRFGLTGGDAGEMMQAHLDGRLDDWMEGNGDAYDGPTFYVKRLNAAAEFLKGLPAASRGVTYDVNLAVDPDHLLDLHAPFSGQSPYVKERLRALGLTEEAVTNFRVKDDGWFKRYSVMDPWDRRVKTAWASNLILQERYWRLKNAREAARRYKWIAGMGGEPLYWGAGRVRDEADANNLFGWRGVPEHPGAVASRRLSEAGIPGSKYWDAESIHKKSGTRNYVMFRDDLIRIVGKYVGGAP
jgi:hypothetical protein